MSKAWEKLESNVKKVNQGVLTIFMAVIIDNTIYLITLWLGYFQKYPVIITVILALTFLLVFFIFQLKFSEKLLSKALENGGLLWREKR